MYRFQNSEICYKLWVLKLGLLNERKSHFLLISFAKSFHIFFILQPGELTSIKLAGNDNVVMQSKDLLVLLTTEWKCLEQ